MANRQNVEEYINKEDEINLLDYWRVLVKHKLLIGVITIVAFAGSVIYSLTLPRIYISKASILPPQQEGSVGSGIISQLPGGWGSLAGGFLGSSTPSGVWMAILKSETIRDAIINHHNLMKTFKTNSMEDARNILGGKITIESSKEGIITLSVKDEDPNMAAALANAFVEELDKVNKGMVTTAGRRTRIFVEERLKDVKIDLTKAEETIKAFQERNRAVQLDAQSTAVMGAIGSVKGQIMAKEVELQTLLSYATPNNPQAELLKTQIEELKEKLWEMEEGKKISDNPSPKDIFIPTAKIPNLSLQYARLIRDAKVYQTLYEMLTQQYEMARIQEAKDTPTVQVLDTAKVPQKSTGPRKRQVVMLSSAIAAFFAIFVAFFLEYMEKLRTYKKPT